MTEGKSRVVVGRYRLARPLGRGGMGAVWAAHDTLLGRDVAVKEIWLPSAGNEPVDPGDPLIRRALREAQAAARLRHPGIVTVHDVVTDDGRPWIVMELIDGRSLAEAIRDHGLLTEQRTAEIGLHVLDALRAAHREGIAHRDVKPANILLGNDRVVLTDFGIAAIDDATALTATGQMVGSPAYLAPERINGQPATAAGDLWALGVTLYAAVTGRSPFQREDTQATFAAILTSRPTTPAHAGRLWPVIKGLLIKDPARRLGAEPARKLLANVANLTGGAEAAAPAAGGRRPRWWPAQSRRPESTLDGLPGTLAAPPPTLAAPTAYQEPPPAPAAAARPAGTVPGPAIAASTVAASTVAASTAAASTAAASTVAADTASADTASADTASADTAAASGDTAGDTAAASGDTAAASADTAAATADTAAATADTATADTAAADTAAAVTAAAALIPIAMQAPATLPSAPHPGLAARPRSRTIWLAAVAVGVVLLAGGILRVAWPGDGGDTGGRESVVGASGGNPSSAAAGAAVKPLASASRSAPANPTLDPCLVGTWRMTSLQVVNHFENVDARFTGPGGVITRIWPDGRSVDDYNKSAPLKATIKGARYVEVLRGIETSHVETRNGHLYTSELSGSSTTKVTRNGKQLKIETEVSSSLDLPYICSETRLTTYGNKNYSTQSYVRISHTP